MLLNEWKFYEIFLKEKSRSFNFVNRNDKEVGTRKTRERMPKIIQIGTLCFDTYTHLSETKELGPQSLQTCTKLFTSSFLLFLKFFFGIYYRYNY